MRHQDKVALVTGGGNGIGRSIALRFAAEGARVAIADRDQAAQDETLETIRAAGTDAAGITTDVSQPEQVQHLVRETLRIFGRIDILVNNAGLVGGSGNFLDVALEDWRRYIDVNLTGMFLVGQAVARSMVERGIRGRIVNVGSVNSFAAEREASPYVASKGGVWLLTAAMAVDLAPHGILVNMLAPGPIRVDRNAPLFDSEAMRVGFSLSVPLARAGTPEECAAAVVFLASDECSFMTGASLVLDGGLRALLRTD